MDDGLVLATISDSISSSLASTMALVHLLPGKFKDLDIAGTPGRKANIFLPHVSFIPEETILLMNGLSKKEITSRMDSSIDSYEAFVISCNRSVKVFQEELPYVRLEEKYTNSDGCSKEGIHYLLDSVAHIAHHRSQIYGTLLREGIGVPKDHLNQLFRSHLKVK